VLGRLSLVIVFASLRRMVLNVPQAQVRIVPQSKVCLSVRLNALKRTSHQEYLRVYLLASEEGGRLVLLDR